MKKTLLASAVLLVISPMIFANTEEELVRKYIQVTNPNSPESYEQKNITINRVVDGGRSPAAVGVYYGGILNLGKKDKTETIIVGMNGNSQMPKAIDVQTKYSTLKINAKKLQVKNFLTDRKTPGWSYGLHVATTGTNTAEEERAVLEINAKDTYVDVSAPDPEKAMALVAMSEGVLRIDSNLYVNTQGGKGKAIVSRGGAQIRINESGNNTVVLKGDIRFDFDAPTSSTPVNADVLVNLSGKESSWTGNTAVAWNGSPTPEDVILSVTGMKLYLSNEAVWTPTVTANDSTSQNTGTKYTNLNHLVLDKGIINIAGNDIDVTVENLKGSGIVNLASDLEAIEGKQTGKFNVKISENAAIDVNLMNQDMTANLTADDITAEQAKKLMANVGGKDSGVAVTTDVPEGMVNNAFGVDAQGNTKTASVNTLMQSSLELAAAAPLSLNRIMMNDVRKRLGDIRTSAGTSGAWARYDGGKLSGEGGLDTDFNTIQVGIDTMPSPASMRFGLAFNYTDGDSDYARGSADMKAYGLAAYGTWLGDNGQFVDVVARLGKSDTDLVVDHTHKGSIKNLAVSLSGEFGWRFDVTDSIYVEPQIEATYTYVNGDNLSLGTAKYDVDSTDSFLGRVGFAAGLKCPNNRGNVYVRASAVHEFLGDSKITGTNGSVSNTYEIDGKDTWVEYGLGANFNLTQSTYVWADLERTSGGALDEDWRATVGVRYAW